MQEANLSTIKNIIRTETLKEIYDLLSEIQTNIPNCQDWIDSEIDQSNFSIFSDCAKEYFLLYTYPLKTEDPLRIFIHLNKDSAPVLCHDSLWKEIEGIQFVSPLEYIQSIGKKQ